MVAAQEYLVSGWYGVGTCASLQKALGIQISCFPFLRGHERRGRAVAWCGAVRCGVVCGWCGVVCGWCGAGVVWCAGAVRCAGEMQAACSVLLS